MLTTNTTQGRMDQSAALLMAPHQAFGENANTGIKASTGLIESQKPKFD